jgi:LPS-assembly protein
MRHRLMLLMLAGLWLCMAGGAGAEMIEVPHLEKKVERLQQQEMPVYIHAQRLEYQRAKNLYIGSGYVDIRYGDIRLQADEVVFDAATGRAKASGNVIMDEGRNRLVGERLEVNLNNKLGVLHQGEVFLAPNYFLTGRRIERLAEDKFLITQGSYTTCDQTIPDWKLRVKRCLIHVGHYAYLTDFSLYVKKVPVFRFPYALVPIKTERATGLLIPRLGYSNVDGFTISESFFWAINDWTDATIWVDYFSKRGIGSGLEFRYALTPEDEGKLQSYLIRDWITKQERWKTEVNVKQELGYGVKGVLKADLLSDRQYEQQFATDISQRRRQEQNSYLWLYKNWNHYGASSVNEYSEDLYQTEKNKYWRLPELKLFAVSQPVLDTPLFYKLEAFGLGWRRKDASGEEETQRLHLHPELRLPWEVGRRTVITPRVGYLQTWYTKNRQGETDQRGLYELGLRVDGPQPYRIYQVKIGRLKGIKHLLQPFIDYNYLPDEDQADLINFDLLDYIPGENVLRYGLIQHFLGRFRSARRGKEKETEEIREFLLLTISQEFDIDELRREEISGQPRRPFSPLKLDWELKPTPGLRLDWEVRYNFYERWIENNNLDLWFKPARYLSLEAGWRYTREEAAADGINFLNAGVNLKLWESIKLGVSGKYNVKSNQWVEDRYSLTYASQCWSVGVSFIERLDEDEVSFSINLEGLSGVGI